MTPRRGAAVFAGGAVVATVLVACSNSKPAVCSDIKDLQTSVQNLRNVSIQAGALTQVQQDVATIRSQFKTFKDDAKSQYSGDVAKVQTSVDVLSSTVTLAKQNPSVSSLAAVGSSAKGVTDSVTSLASAVKGTC